MTGPDLKPPASEDEWRILENHGLTLRQYRRAMRQIAVINFLAWLTAGWVVDALDRRAARRKEKSK